MSDDIFEKPYYPAVEETLDEYKQISMRGDAPPNPSPPVQADKSEFPGGESQPSTKALETVRDALRCPACRGRLQQLSDDLVCADIQCGMQFPVVDGIPVLINDEHSLFDRADYVSGQSTAFDPSRNRWTRLLDRWLPNLGHSIVAPRNYRILADLLCEQTEKPVVLVVGGRTLGNGMEQLATHPKIQLVETDVSFGPRTRLICDAHDLPFENNSVDGVVSQAVLQYVPDPARCVREIERVVKPDGLVYAETAFMQQVVHGRYDFTRYTHLGLRRLFRAFDEAASGPACGPAMALAWSVQFLLLSLANSRWIRRAAYAFSRLTLFWLKYLDAALLNNRGTYDAASGFYFLGRKRCQTISDRELIALYRGAQ